MWEAITVIEAQNQLKQFSAGDWPNMKKNSRAKLHRELFSQAYPDEIKTKKTISVSDLKKIMGGQ